MRISIILLATVALIQSCGVGSGSRSHKKVPLWTYIPSDEQVQQKYLSARYILDTRRFVDSFVHYEAHTRGQKPDVPLLMPLPNLEGYTEDYYFTPIYQLGSQSDTTTLGFIGTNKSNKRDISSLYIKNDQITVKWKTSSKEWLLQLERGDDTTKTRYILMDLVTGQPEIAAPRPIDTY